MHNRPQLIDSAVSRRRNIDGILPNKAATVAPVEAPAASPAPQLRQHKPHLQPHPLLQRRPNTTDGMRPTLPPGHGSGGSATQPRGATAIAVARKAQLPVKAAAQTRTKPKRPRAELRHHVGKLTVIGIVAGSIFGFLSFFSLQLGEIVIGVYAVIVIWRRLPSRLTFMIALAMFGGIIATQLLIPDSDISENMAVYAFLLLCVGTISLAREVRHNDDQPDHII